MKYVNQFCIILAFSFAGEILNCLIPLPVPASIYGLLLMFLALEFKIIKVHHVKEVSSFLLGIMSIFFVPSSVGFKRTSADEKIRTAVFFNCHSFNRYGFCNYGSDYANTDEN